MQSVESTADDRVNNYFTRRLLYQTKTNRATTGRVIELDTKHPSVNANSERLARISSYNGPDPVRCAEDLHAIDSTDISLLARCFSRLELREATHSNERQETVPASDACDCTANAVCRKCSRDFVGRLRRRTYSYRSARSLPAISEEADDDATAVRPVGNTETHFHTRAKFKWHSSTSRRNRVRRWTQNK
jgi:hypothetical protein